MASQSSHRSKEFRRCPVVGAKKELPSIDSAIRLPTNLDVLLHLDFLKHQKLEATSQEPLLDPLIKQTSLHVKQIWLKASIPTLVSDFRTYQMISKLHDERHSLKKSVVARPESKVVQAQLLKFQAKLNGLFDIALCKCRSFEQCTCDKNSKVPSLEQPFLLDKRGARKMTMGSVDQVETKKNLKRLERQAKTTASIEAKCAKLFEAPSQPISSDNHLDLPPEVQISNTVDSSLEMTPDDHEFSVSSFLENQVITKNMGKKAVQLSLPFFARSCD